MKILLMGLLAVTISGSAMANETSGEVGYERGSLGYDALLAGENNKALKQILASDVEMTDPAKLINLGVAYARVGQTAKAEAAFQAALDCRNHGDLELADGRIMNSRTAAALSLKNLQSRTAMR
ncbi:hypothetical protein ACFOWX_10470 [Sphingorhabdus arenilitoris]|uniref:Tetratricopeptide repeat protein n=1 Tax=Sphingorhabdus arenilitoris TaxID=1490041 RepID=A0ABV8RHJ9_9SPHN